MVPSLRKAIATARFHHTSRRHGTAWPRGACAQQAAMPVIGFLGATSPDAANADYLRVFRQALKESG